MVTGRTRQGNGPTAIETKLGWVLSGPDTGLSCESTSMSLLSCHTQKAEASTIGCTDATFDDTLKKFWDLEAIGIKAEESSVYEEFTQNVVFRNGRYCVHLPWKGYHPPLPDNFNLCQTRLFGLIKRLRQSPHILREYDNINQKGDWRDRRRSLELGKDRQATLSASSWCHPRRQIYDQAPNCL